MKNLTTIAAIAGLATLACTLTRANAADFRTETVKFADLNTSTSSGAAVLYQRLKYAAESVCKDLDSRRLALMLPHAQCVHTALSNAIANIDLPAVTAYAAAHGAAASDGRIKIARTN